MNPQIQPRKNKRNPSGLRSTRIHVDWHDLTSAKFVCSTKTAFSGSNATISYIIGRSDPISIPTEMVVLKKSAREEMSLFLPRTLQNRFELQLPKTLRAAFSADPPTLRIGPCIAILHHFEADQLPEWAPFAQHVCNKQSAQMQFFHYKENVPAWYNVIYNRIGKRQLEATSEVANLLNHWSALPRLSLFNARFLNKCEVHEFLLQHHSLHHWLIPAHVLRNGLNLTACKQNVIQLFRAHSDWYFKPDQGSGGIGIWRVKAQDRELRLPLLVQQSGASTASADVMPKIERHEMSFDAFSRLLKRKLDRQAFLVQKTISLQKHHGLRFDFRVLTQRTRTNEWQVSSIICRMLSPDGMTCNLRQGGQLGDAATMISKQEREILKQASIQISRALADSIPWRQPLAELGLDWGYTKQHEFRLIEANAKPARPNIVDAPLTDRKIPLSWKNWMDYCLYLGGF